MKTLLFVLCWLIPFIGFGATPTLTDFNPNQFATNNGKITIKNGATVTNLVGAGGDTLWTVSDGALIPATVTNRLIVGDLDATGFGSDIGYQTTLAYQIGTKTGDVAGGIYSFGISDGTDVGSGYFNIFGLQPKDFDYSGTNDISSSTFTVGMWIYNYTRSTASDQSIWRGWNGNYGLVTGGGNGDGYALLATNQSAAHIAQISSSGSGLNVANYGLILTSNPRLSGQTNVASGGIVIGTGGGTIPVGGFFGISASSVDSVPLSPSGLIVDNFDSGLPSLIIRTNKVPVLIVDGALNLVNDPNNNLHRVIQSGPSNNPFSEGRISFAVGSDPVFEILSGENNDFKLSSDFGFAFNTGGGVTLVATIDDSGITPNFGIKGKSSTGDATAGNVDEYIEALVGSGSAGGISSATATNFVSLSLTAGDWDVSFQPNLTATAATVTAMSAGINTTSATIPTDGSEGYSGVLLTIASATDSIHVMTKRVSLATPTVVFGVVKGTFSAGTMKVFGKMSARRRQPGA